MLIDMAGEKEPFVRSESLLQAAMALSEGNAQFSGSFRLDHLGRHDTALFMEVEGGPRCSVVFDTSHQTLLTVDGETISTLNPRALSQQTLYKTMSIALRIAPGTDTLQRRLIRTESKFQWEFELQSILSYEKKSLASLGIVTVTQEHGLVSVRDAFGSIASFSATDLENSSRDGAFGRYILTRLTHGVSVNNNLTDIRWI